MEDFPEFEFSVENQSAGIYQLKTQILEMSDLGK